MIFSSLKSFAFESIHFFLLRRSHGIDRGYDIDERVTDPSRNWDMESDIKRVLNLKARKSKFFNTPIVDVCPGCRKKFLIGTVSVVYKDVFECQRCGKIWVSNCPDQVMRFI